MGFKAVDIHTCDACGEERFIARDRGLPARWRIQDHGTHKIALCEECSKLANGRGYATTEATLGTIYRDAIRWRRSQRAKRRRRDARKA